MRKLLLISVDAIGDDAFDIFLSNSPNFARLVERSCVHRGVSSIFLSNTYPVHTSVATGFTPKYHGIINNTDPFPSKHPKWHYEAKKTNVTTLWQAAKEKKLRTAAVMWPVTGGSREIDYNIPELLTQPGENQILLNMKYGSKLLQLHLFLKYKKLLNKGTPKQPETDYFSTACMAYILRKKSPDLAMMHLTAYDSLCHENGLNSGKLEAAYEAMDANLGVLLEAAGDKYDIILFSDHSQLPAENSILPNKILEDSGYIETDENGEYLHGDCFFECCGGCAFLHEGDLKLSEIEKIKRSVQSLTGYERLLRADEMDICGRADLPFGFAAKPGWTCEAYRKNEKANHGYPVDYDNYKVFYLCCGKNFSPGILYGGSLLNITEKASEILNLNMKH